MILAISVFPRTRFNIAIPIAAIAFILATIFLYRRFCRRRNEAITLPAGFDVRDAVAAVIPRIRGMEANSGLKRIARALVEQGRAGATVRIGRANDAGPVQPLAFQFEPQVLNEAVSDLVLAAAAGGRELDADAFDPTKAGADSARLRRTIVRNVVLKGGWAMVILSAIQAVIGALESIDRHKISSKLVVWSVILLLVLLLPARPQLWRSIEFLVVPGGLIRRKAGLRERGWQLKVYDRRRSALVVARMFRHRYGAFVADAGDSDMFIGTRKEMNFLLRAWLSPLSPPEVERLSDLA
jgi:hypothetical protein